MERTFIGWRQSHGKPPKGPPAVNGPNRTGWIHAECSGFLPEAHVVDLQMSIATKVQQNITVRNGRCEDIFHELI